MDGDEMKITIENWVAKVVLKLTYSQTFGNEDYGHELVTEGSKTHRVGGVNRHTDAARELGATDRAVSSLCRVTRLATSSPNYNTLSLDRFNVPQLLYTVVFCGTRIEAHDKASWST
ncbi:hypothetical protein TNCV_3843711 [Trichonephila clavipes]|nr:hypothetical protein TNCV_3843711 [Trichonephila clavipes]